MNRVTGISFLICAFSTLLACLTGCNSFSADHNPAQPAITSFTANPTAVMAGGTASLTGVFSNGTGVITPGNISITSGTAVSVSPAQTTTYLLTVTHSGGSSVAQTETVRVNPLAPTIASFTANPTTITTGGSVSLTGVFANGTGVITPGNLTVTSGTAVSVSPANTTTYTLTVTNSAGDIITQPVTVTVNPTAPATPTISSFTASSTTITAGASTNLTGVFAGGTGVITPGNLSAISGTGVSVSPTDTTIYTLTVTNSVGATASRAVTVTVIGPQTITFVNPGPQTVGTPLTLSATASSGLGVSFASTTTSICTVSGTTATFLTSGSCTITATQAGNASYAAATPVTQSFTVNAGQTAQTITFANPGAQTVGTPLALSATASSGLAVSFASTTTSACTVSGTTATFLTAGTCTIAASQPGNATYAAATPVSQSFTVNPAPPVLVATITIPSTAFVAVSLTTTITATVLPANAATKTLTWSSSDPTVATVSSTGVVTGLKDGTTNITAQSTDGSNILSNTCLLTVTQNSTFVTQIILPLTQTVYVGSTGQIAATVLPSTATNTTLDWSSSDTNVATIDASGVVTGVKVGTVQITAKSTDGTNVTSNFCMLSVTFSPGSSGWTDFKPGLVASDGTHSLGDNGAAFNTTRDKGSKIVYFNVATGNNDTAEAYWWDGSNIVDSSGHTANGSGQVYGTDPLNPNEAAIKPFKQAIGMTTNTVGDPRLRSHMYVTVSGSYADWFLFRRGQVHDTFDSAISGGKNESQPLVVAGYGPLTDGRAIIAPIQDQTVTYKGNSRKTTAPFQMSTGDAAVWMNMAISGLELRTWWESAGFQDADSLAGGPATLFVEDCAWIDHAAKLGATLLYLPKKTTIHRSIIAFAAWSDDGSHTLGYYTSGSNAQVTFDDVIFYKGGFQSDPLITPDPRRDIFSRNIYEGGGAWMGHVYRNFISADGGSGGPQMRFGGLMENSLIAEGYWYSATESNGEGADWVTTANRQSGNPSAIVQNNVQLVFAYPTVDDPDPMSISDPRSQPGWGYSALAATFGTMVSGNIISGAMLQDDLGEVPANDGGRYGFLFSPLNGQYPDGNSYTLQSNTVRNNIFYRTELGLQLDSDWTGVTGNLMEGNVFAVGTVTGSAPSKGNLIDASSATNLTGTNQLTLRNNRFYAGSGATLPSAAWMGSGNTLALAGTAATAEGWTDPNRTLKRYVKEVVGLTLLDWSDDPYLGGNTDPGTVYDPAGLKTFMAVATHMRRGGVTSIPASGKPSWTEDYAWDERFTAQAVVNWIRAGFGQAPVQ